MPSRGPDPAMDRLIQIALAEDIGPGDVTTRLTIPLRTRTRARLVARQPGVLAGMEVCHRVFLDVSTHVNLTARIRDGASYRTGSVLALVRGPARAVLAAERTALNFLQRLSGIATLTRRYVDAVKGTNAEILDTRKTTPGWRALEKYAVRCGGGSNHRMGLYDMVLIKDNHIAAAGSVAVALERTQDARVPVEVEVRTIAQLRAALAAGARRILLDNMGLSRMRRAVTLARGRAKLEASGGITLRRVRAVAETGVDYISIGALTHSAPAADIALDFDAG